MIYHIYLSHNSVNKDISSPLSLRLTNLYEFINLFINFFFILSKMRSSV